MMSLQQEHSVPQAKRPSIEPGGGGLFGAAVVPGCFLATAFGDDNDNGGMQYKDLMRAEKLNSSTWKSSTTQRQKCWMGPMPFNILVDEHGPDL